MFGSVSLMLACVVLLEIELVVDLKELQYALLVDQ